MIVQIKNVTKTFMGAHSLDNVNLTFHAGDKVAIMGANGAGKTTLVRAMMGYYHVAQGTVQVNGYDPVKNRVHVLNETSFIPQLPPPIKISCEELITFTVKSAKCDESLIYAYAARMGLDLSLHVKKSFFKLSGGMKQKLLIAIALAKKSKLMIFDEPTANLDPDGRAMFYEMLGEVDKETTMIFISHRLDEIEHLVNRLVYMDLGKVMRDEMV